MYFINNKQLYLQFKKKITYLHNMLGIKDFYHMTRAAPRAISLQNHK